MNGTNTPTLNTGALSDRYVELMRLVTNPKCYAQTVENLFYLSSLVTNGSVRMKVIEGGQMAVSFRPVTPPPHTHLCFPSVDACDMQVPF
jgi:hypothetical protein